MSKSSPVLVDPKGGKGKNDRTYAETLIGHLEALDVPCLVTPMDFGDVAFIGHGGVSIGVEIKRIPDLVTSLHGGRLLDHQVPGLLRTYDRAWLVVEGMSRLGRGTGLLEGPKGPTWKPLGHGKRPTRWADIEALYTKLEYGAGIPVRRTRSTFETASLIRVLYRYCQKATHSPLREVTYVAARADMGPVDPTEKLLREIASRLPGLGWDRAVRASKWFPDVGSMIRADEDEWRLALGIKGKRSETARRVVEALTRPKGAS